MVVHVAKITPIPSDVFTAENQSALIRTINSLWNMQIDTVTQKRVMAALEIDKIPDEWVEELTENIDFFITEQFNPVMRSKTAKAGNEILDQAEEALNTIFDYELGNSALSFIDNEALGLSVKLKEPLKRNVVNTLRLIAKEGLGVSDAKALFVPSMTLTVQENEALLAFWARLDPKKVSKRRQAQLTISYYKKLQRRRSERIARTELTRVKLFGEMDGINQQVSMGNLKGATKTWRRSNFQDNWDSSIENDGDTKQINEPFDTPCQTGNDQYPSEINEYCYLEYDVR